MASSRLRFRAIVYVVVGAILALIYVAAFLTLTPPLVHPWLIVILAVAAVFRGATLYRSKDQSES